jgi:ribosomal protein S18 acetylase RimI-like enzyme
MDDNEIIIRTVNFPEEYDSVLALWASAGPGVQIRHSDSPAEMLKKVKMDPGLFLAAEKNGEIVGAVLGGFDGRRGMVYHLAVAEHVRHSGIALSLMNEIEHRLRERGCIKYYLLVTRENERALQFYDRFGCEVMDLFVLGKELR